MSILGPRSDHGTRACYVSGCRCAPCREANVIRYRQRMAKMRELAVDVVPSGPPIMSTLMRAGKTYKVRRCPGANGNVCVKGGAWLRGQGAVCSVCVERETVWDGLVPPVRARAHLLKLRAAGVGYKAVAAASDVAASALCRILRNDEPIRATTERRVLAIDAGAMADHAIVSAEAMNAQIATMRARGFTLRHLAQLMGYAERDSVLQLGKRQEALAVTVAKVDRLMRKVERGEIRPRRAFVDGLEERRWLAEMIDRGLTATWLSDRLGFVVARNGRMKPDNAASVHRLRAELDEIRREGTGTPEDWMSPDSSSLRLTKGFGFDGGWMVRGGTNGKSDKRLRKTIDQEVRRSRRRSA